MYSLSCIVIALRYALLVRAVAFGLTQWLLMQMPQFSIKKCVIDVCFQTPL